MRSPAVVCLPRLDNPARGRAWALVAATLACVLVATSGLAAEMRGKPASVTTSITGTPAEVHAALEQALSTWRMRKSSLEEGIVKTDWVRRTKGKEVYQGRIVAEFREDGYTTLLTVRHEKQRQMTDLQSPSLGGPSAEWRDWDGDFEIARDVVRSVEHAFGMEPEAVSIDTLSSRARAPVAPITIPRCIVPPEAAARIDDLKVRRRDLVREVKAMDAQILEAVYDGKYDAIKDEVERLKTRKAAMEAQITDIDREILAMVVAD